MFNIRRIAGAMPLVSAIGGSMPARAKGSFKTSVGQQAKFFAKVVSGRSPKRWYEPRDPKPITPNTILKMESKGAARRVVVLNNLFMRHITDIMASGDVSEILLGNGIEISHVKMAIDFRIVNVFWACSDSKVDVNEIEKKLRSIEGPLRHELSQLRLIGEVPRIQFVKDKQLIALRELDHVMAIADYGDDDYEPMDAAKQERKEFTPEYRTTAVDSDDPSIPQMRQDVFGLDRASIMNRITASMTKNKQYSGLVEPKELAPSEVGYVTESMVERAESERAKNKELLDGFLKGRRLERTKLRKEARVTAREEDYDNFEEKWQKLQEDSYNYNRRRAQDRDEDYEIFEEKWKE